MMLIAMATCYGTGLRYRDDDSNYVSDFNQLLKYYADMMYNSDEGDAGEDVFWFASRGYYSSSMYSGYGVYYSFYWSYGDGLGGFVGEPFTMSFWEDWHVNDFGIFEPITAGLRPVFTVDSLHCSVLYGSGTQEDPYRWTVDIVK